MPAKKGEPVKGEQGIWKHPDGKGYLAEVSCCDPQTGRRTREVQSFNRLDLAKEWRITRKVDAQRGDLRRRKDQPKPVRFDALVEDYLAQVSDVTKRPSSAARDRTSFRRLNRTFGARPTSGV
jgi:hypothetical protein